MPINVDEIKKLPNEEKLKIIDELWESIEDDWESEEYEESPEVIQLLEERQAAYERGEMKFTPWEDVLKRLREKLQDNNKDGLNGQL
jgi:putative addiction module component (TIGR02574 family)